MGLDKETLPLSIDSTHIEAFKFDKDASMGAKKADFFHGCKVQVVVSNTEPPLPISIEVAPANRHDGKLPKPLCPKGSEILKHRR